MNARFVIGIVLIIVGIIALTIQGISYTKKEKVIDVGPIHATAEHKKTVPVPPVVGGAALAAGVVLVIFGTKT